MHDGAVSEVPAPPPYTPLPAQSAARADLRGNIRDLVAYATTEAGAARKAARWWSLIHLWLGLPTAVVAAVAGITGLASTTGRVPAAILALAAACLSAASTFLGADGKATNSLRQAAAWTTLAADGRLVDAFEGNRAVSADLRNQLSLLLQRQDAILSGDLEVARQLREHGAGRVVSPADFPYPSPPGSVSSPGEGE